MLNASGVRLSQDATASETKHIAVCLCTYKRPELLKRLLQELGEQDTEGLFTYSIVVVDNDRLQSAESVVANFAATSKVSVKYDVEPQQNIALARNRSIENASGDFVAFIDDDEFPSEQWLLSLFHIFDKGSVAGVLGPVLPYFGDGVPPWIVKGKFYDRPQHRTGLVLGWTQTRTGNVLLQRHLFAGDPQPFRAECVEGSDQEFFKRMMQKGHEFVWCNEAVVYEVVPPPRWKRSFLVRRALFRGIYSVRNHGLPLQLIATSLIAAPAYAAALPVALVLGHARFMDYVFKLSYHTGRLLAALGLNPVSRPYVSE
jgi:glycosyltransferase involved in cell wall biosynthesis